MTTLYRPLLIESAGQAEALPEGTVAQMHHASDRRTYVTVRVRGGWHDEHFQASGPMPHSEVLGMEALVPIEAEEGTDTIETGEGHFYTRTRLVTPWEASR